MSDVARKYAVALPHPRKRALWIAESRDPYPAYVLSPDPRTMQRLVADDLFAWAGERDGRMQVAITDKGWRVREALLSKPTRIRLRQDHDELMQEMGQ